MQWAENRRIETPAALGRPSLRDPIVGLIVALVLVAGVAALDYVTGYEMRFAILYLVPIAVATWIAGTRSGILIVMLSSLCWLLSFRSAHVYSSELFFYWEGFVMLAAFATFIYLLSRLRVALDRADERFVRVLEELHAAVYVADEDSGALLYANRRVARMMNTDPISISLAELERRFGRIASTPAEDARRKPARATNSGFVSEEVQDQTNGRWYLVQAGPIPWKHNRRVSLKVITDISEQRHAHSLKRQHQDILHQTARLAALAEIATSLAHEVNQPLMAIASYNDACLRLLAAPNFDKAEVVTALERCRRQALRAGRIIGRVRDFIRSRHPNPTQCDVNSIVREALELMESRLEHEAVSLRLALADSLPPTQADKTLLVQVMVNLMQNAVDAMQASPPSRRELRITTERGEDGEILVSVADQGEGIPAAIAERLHKPFITTKPHGLGLGLPICRSVVEAHGGRLWHTANPDGGCTFHFTIAPELE